VESDLRRLLVFADPDHVIVRSLRTRRLGP
jgi:hypothetical protein